MPYIPMSNTVLRSVLKELGVLNSDGIFSKQANVRKITTFSIMTRLGDTYNVDKAELYPSRYQKGNNLHPAYNDIMAELMFRWKSNPCKMP